MFMSLSIGKPIDRHRCIHICFSRLSNFRLNSLYPSVARQNLSCQDHQGLVVDGFSLLYLHTVNDQPMLMGSDVAVLEERTANPNPSSIVPFSSLEEVLSTTLTKW